MEKKFSVLMSVYKKDNPKYFEQAVESIINQTVIPSEVVIVIDGPIYDELKIAVNNMAKKHSIIKIIALEENLGLGLALKKGMEYCSYELIARMDSDDISCPNRFEKQLECFEKDENLSLVGSNISEFIDNDQNIISKRNVPEKHQDICKYLKKRCPFNHMTVMFKKASVEQAGGYLDYKFMEDYYLWIRMFLSKSKFYNIQDTLVLVRVSNDMYKRRAGYKYFKNMASLYKYMLKNRIISYPMYFFNNLSRFLIQVLMPNFIRKIIYKHFLRKKQGLK